MSGSDNSFFMGVSLGSFKGIEVFKWVGVMSGVGSHKEYEFSEVFITFFGDVSFTFEFSGVFRDWVNTCVSDNFLIGREVIDGIYFRYEGGCFIITDTFNGIYDGEMSWVGGFNHMDERGFKGFHLLYEGKEYGYFGDKYLVFNWVIDGEVRGSDIFQYFRGDIRVFTFTSEGLIYTGLDLAGREGRGYMSGRYKGEEFKHFNRSNITMVFQSIEGIEEDLFNLVFELCYGAGELGNFSADVSCFMWFVGRGEGRMVVKEEEGDSFGIYFVSFGVSDGFRLFKVMDNRGVNEINGFIMGFEEGEEVNVIVTSGFHGEDSVIWYRGYEGVKVGDRVRESGGEDNFGVLVNASCMEGMFGHVNTYEEHRGPPFLGVKRYSPPILPGNEGFKAQSTNRGGGSKQGKDSFKGSWPRILSSPASYNSFSDVTQRIHIGSNGKTFLCNSKIITNLT